MDTRRGIRISALPAAAAPRSDIKLSAAVINGWLPSTCAAALFIVSKNRCETGNVRTGATVPGIDGGSRVGRVIVVVTLTVPSLYRVRRTTRRSLIFLVIISKTSVNI